MKTSKHDEVFDLSDLEGLAEIVSEGVAYRKTPMKWELPASAWNMFCEITMPLPALGECVVNTMVWPAGFSREENNGGSKLLEGTEFIVIPLRGSITFAIDGDNLTLSPGEVWTIDFRTPHVQSNDGDEDALYLAVQVQWFDAEAWKDDEAEDDDQNGMSSPSSMEGEGEDSEDEA